MCVPLTVLYATQVEQLGTIIDLSPETCLHTHIYRNHASCTFYSAVPSLPSTHDLHTDSCIGALPAGMCVHADMFMPVCLSMSHTLSFFFVFFSAD